VSSTTLPPSSVDIPPQQCNSGSSDPLQAQSRQSLLQLDATYRSEAGNLLRYLRRKVGEDAAPDLLQEVFLRTAKRRHLTVFNNPAAYLQRVARNLLIEYHHTRRRWAAVIIPLEDHHDAASPPEQLEHLEAQRLMQRYENAVASMPEKTRRIFLMHRVDELTYQEIHETLGITVKTVEYHMAMALARLAKRLDVKR
jgi:RNA polymerase sigma factor (sigma-70 family)